MFELAAGGGDVTPPAFSNDGVDVVLLQHPLEPDDCFVSGSLEREAINFIPAQ